MRHSRDPVNSQKASGRRVLGGEAPPPAATKRHRRWIAAGLVAASMALAACAAFAALWGLGISAGRLSATLATVEKAAAHSAEKRGILGLWYETEGYGTIEFFRDGSFRISVSDYYWETGTYKYNTASGTGEYTLDDSRIAVTMRMENGQLDIEGARYTTEAVEPQEMSWDDIIEYID
jgi:ABC-type amino acid transport substrate-binding protein